jgi:hypothetical protein
MPDLLNGFLRGSKGETTAGKVSSHLYAEFIKRQIFTPKTHISLPFLMQEMIRQDYRLRLNFSISQTFLVQFQYQARFERGRKIQRFSTHIRANPHLHQIGIFQSIYNGGDNFFSVSAFFRRMLLQKLIADGVNSTAKPAYRLFRAHLFEESFDFFFINFITDIQPRADQPLNTESKFAVNINVETV